MSVQENRCGNQEWTIKKQRKTGYKTEQKQTIHIKTRDCVTPVIILFIYLQVYKVRDISY